MSELTLLVLRQSRWKAAGSLALTCILAVVGVAMISGVMPESSRYSPEFIRLVGLATILLCVWLGFLGLYGLIKPGRLILTLEGFRVTGLRARGLVPWASVDRFFITEIRNASLVSYDLKFEAKTPLQRAAGHARAFGGGDGYIPNYFIASAGEVLHLLTDWRARYVG